MATIKRLFWNYHCLDHLTIELPYKDKKQGRLDTTFSSSSSSSFFTRLNLEINGFDVD